MYNKNIDTGSNASKWINIRNNQIYINVLNISKIVIKNIDTKLIANTNNKIRSIIVQTSKFMDIAIGKIDVNYIFINLFRQIW